MTPLRQGDGWQSYCVENDEYLSDRCAGTTTITTQTKDQLAAQTAALSELTAQVAGALNLSGGESSGQTPPGGIGRRGSSSRVSGRSARCLGMLARQQRRGRCRPGVGSSQQAQRVPFAGQHQPTIVATPVAGRSALASFKVFALDREEPRTMFADLSTTIADLMAGRLPEQRGSAYPPAETGVLGAEPARPPGDRRLGRGKPVRRAVRARGSQAHGTGRDAVPLQRPA